MKSIYVDDQLHGSLKVLASLEGKALTDVVEECLRLSLHKKLSDLPAEMMEKLAASGGGFDFLLDQREDIYTLEDGKSLS